MSISSNIRVGSLIGADLRVGNVAPLAAYYGDELVFRFNPASLFASGEQGAWYDPSDLSTMFTNTAGTTPATVGDSVARINDKSGRGNHATQDVFASRPILRQTAGGQYYLEFDGVGDFLQTPTITPNTDKAQLFAGVRKLSDANAAGLLSMGSPGGNGSMELRAPDTSSNSRYLVETGGTVLRQSATSSAPSPTTDIISVLTDIAAPLTTLRRNGSVAQSNINGMGTGNFLAYPVFIGARGGTSIPFNGHIYSLIIRFGANLDAATIESVEGFVADKTGVTL